MARALLLILLAGLLGGCTATPINLPNSDAGPGAQDAAASKSDMGTSRDGLAVPDTGPPPPLDSGATKKDGAADGLQDGLDDGTVGDGLKSDVKTVWDAVRPE